MLIGATLPNVTASYGHWPEGGRAWKTVNGATTLYLEVDGVEWAAYGPDGTLKERYVRASGTGGAVLAVKQGSTLSWLLPNRQGSVIAWTRPDGRVGGTFAYDPYGNSPQAGTAGPPFRYAGMRFDAETGLYLTPFRSYDPQDGRWMQLDPIGIKDGLNRYAYVGNDPLGKVDPSGQFGVAGFLIGAGLDLALQVGSNLAEGDSLGEAIGDVDLGSVAVSGALGAVGQVGGAQALTSFAKGLSISTKGKIGEAVARAKIALNGEKVIARGQAAREVKALGEFSGKAGRAKPDFVVEGKNGVRAVEAKFGDAKLTQPQKALQRTLGDKFEVVRTSYDDVANVGGAAGGATGGTAGAVITPSCTEDRKC